MFIQPSARAVAAAAALQESKRAREASRKASEFQWSGQVDFDITAAAGTPPHRRDWKKIALWVLAAAAGMMTVVIAIWWGLS